MTNKQYERGRRFEYEMVNLLKKHLDPKRYTIIRTAGSHSPVDVVVIKHITREVFGIQCKTKKIIPFKTDYGFIGEMEITND